MGEQLSSTQGFDCITGIPNLLTGDVALVTGGAQGNGAAIAAGLARSGASVVIGDLDIERARGCADNIQKFGGQAHALELDVASPESCASVAAGAGRHFGPVSILVNNAGIFRRSSIDDPGFLEVASQQLKVNVEGSLNAVHALLPQLRQTKGRVVNVGSIASYISYRRNVVGYAASKGAVMQMTKGLAADLADDGIRVNAIAPGLIKTRMTEASRSQPAVMDELFAHALMKRFAEPDELVGVVLFLTSRLSTFVTGVIVPVDGGFVAI